MEPQTVSPETIPFSDEFPQYDWIGQNFLSSEWLYSGIVSQEAFGFPQIELQYSIISGEEFGFPTILDHTISAQITLPAKYRTYKYNVTIKKKRN